MKQKNFWENIIFVIILLVVVQTFVDDLARYMHWTVKTRNILTVSGFCFDLIFSIEFIIRLLLAKKEKSVGIYLFYKRGWVDFLSSIPLLLLSSGPAVVLLFSHGALGFASISRIFSALKILKTIRVTRILRLVRIIKIFGKIQNAESKMAQHHTATIATTAVFTVLLSQVIFVSFFQTNYTSIMADRISFYKKNISLVNFKNKKNIKMFENYLLEDKNIVACKYNNKNLFWKNKDSFNIYYDEDDYQVLNYKGIELIISGVDINSGHAMDNLKVFFLIIFLLGAFMIIYTRHFAQNISDVIHVMNSGFRKRNYNFQVKINKNYADHEVFNFAKYYNEIYLPAKLKKISSKDGEKSDLSMKDFLSFNKK